MKQFILYTIFLTTFFSACKKEDDHLFNKSPDERLNETLAGYQTKLETAQNGWKGLLYPKGGGIYTFYFKFNNLNRVQMLSGFDSTSAVTFKESSYRLKALQQPSLVFDTYSYLHVLSDPDPRVNGGVVGAGLQSDFEFYFDSSSTDTINLVGRQNGSKAVLVRATAAEAAAFSNGQLANGLLLSKILTYYKRLTIGSVSLDFNLDASTGSIKLPDNNGNLLDSSKIFSYYLTLNGISFTKPLVAGNQIITALNNLDFAASTQTVNCTVNSLPATVTQVIEPIKVDVGAPQRWWNDAVSRQSYYVSVDGFHVNGVDDAYQLSSIAGYQYLYFEPKFGTSGGISYDLLAPIINDSLNYGAAFRAPTFTGGLAIFRYLGDLGTVPTGQAAIYSAMVSKINDRSGYYLVQTGAREYDMVSARDGKSWISWFGL